jgi:hypothetical protein
LQEAESLRPYVPSRVVRFDIMCGDIPQIKEHSLGGIVFEDFVYEDANGKGHWVYDSLRPFLARILEMHWLDFCLNSGTIRKQFALAHFETFLKHGILMDPYEAMRGVMKGYPLDSKGDFVWIWKHRYDISSRFSGRKNVLLNVLFQSPIQGTFLKDISFGPLPKWIDRQLNSLITNNSKEIFYGQYFVDFKSLMLERAKHGYSESYWKAHEFLRFMCVMKDQLIKHADVKCFIFYQQGCDLLKFIKFIKGTHREELQCLGRDDAVVYHFIVQQMGLYKEPFGLKKLKCKSDAQMSTKHVNIVVNLNKAKECEAQMGFEMLKPIFAVISECFQTMFSILKSGAITIASWLSSFGGVFSTKLDEWWTWIKGIISNVKFGKLIFKLGIALVLFLALREVMGTMRAVLDVMKAISHLFWGAIPCFEPGEIEVTECEAQSGTALFGIASILSFAFGESISLKRLMPAFQIYNPGKSFLQDLQELCKPMFYWAMAKFTGDSSYLDCDDQMAGVRLAQDYEGFYRDNPQWKFNDQTITKSKQHILDLNKRAVEFKSRIVSSTSLSVDKRRDFTDLVTRINADYVFLLQNEPSFRCRKKPVVVLLQGPPKQGKTEMSFALIHAVYEYCREKGLHVDGYPLQEYKPTERWSKADNTTYWDGYRRQFCYYKTELAATKDENTRSQEMNEFLKLADDMPFPCNTAFGDKGSVFFSSRLIVITTNFVDWNHTGMTDPEAVIRRFDFPVDVARGEELPREGITVDQWNKAWKLSMSGYMANIKNINDIVLKATDNGTKVATFTFSDLVKSVAENILANDRSLPRTSNLDTLVKDLISVVPHLETELKVAAHTVYNKDAYNDKTDDKGKGKAPRGGKPFAQKQMYMPGEIVKSDAQMWVLGALSPVISYVTGSISQGLALAGIVKASEHMAGAEYFKEEMEKFFSDAMAVEDRPVPDPEDALKFWYSLPRILEEGPNFFKVKNLGNVAKWLRSVPENFVMQSSTAMGGLLRLQQFCSRGGVNAYDTDYAQLFVPREDLAEWKREQDSKRISPFDYTVTGPLWEFCCQVGWNDIAGGTRSIKEFSKDCFFSWLAPLLVQMAFWTVAVATFVGIVSYVFSYYDGVEGEEEVQAESWVKDPGDLPIPKRRGMAHSADSLQDKAMAAFHHIKKARLIGPENSIICPLLVSGFGFFTNKHTIQYIGGTLHSVQFLDTNNTEIGEKCDVTYTSDLNGRDVVVCEFSSKTRGAFPCLKNKLKYKNETLKRGKLARVCKRIRVKNGVAVDMATVITGTDFKQNTNSMLNCSQKQNGDKIRIPMENYVIVRDCKGQVGDCMFPYVSDAEERGYIVGVHVGGVHGDSIMAPIYVDDLTSKMRAEVYTTKATSEKIELHGMKDPYAVSEAQHETIIDEVPHFDGLDTIGRLKMEHMEFVPTDHGFVETCFSEDLPKLVMPAMLTKEKVGNVVVDPQHNMLKKYAERLHIEDTSVMKMIQEDPIEYTKSFPRPSRRPRKLTLEEALEGNDVVESSKFDASVTWDCRYAKTRHNLWRKDSNGKVLWIDQDLRTMIRELDQMASQPNVEVLSSATLCFKAELRPILRRMQGKTRGFQVVSIVFGLWCKMYVGDLMGLLKENWVDNQSGPGVNPTSVEWERILKYLDQVQGDDYIAADCNGWDLSIKYFMWISLHAYFCEVFSIAEGTADWWRYMNIAKSCLKTILVYKCWVYILYDGICSGHYLTSFANTFFNSVIHRSLFYRMRPVNCDLDFDEVIKLVLYGDDNLGKVAQQVSSWYNMFTLAEGFRKYFGMNYTNANKSAVDKAFVTLEDVDFLSRKFRLEERGHGICKTTEVFAPLDKEAIYGMLSWVRKPKEPGVTVEQQLKINIETATREMYHHGEASYSAFCMQMSELCNKHDISGVVFRPYSYWDSCRLESRVSSLDRDTNLENASFFLGTQEELAL